MDKMETNTFEFRYNATGPARKQLVNAIGQIMETKPKYLGAPSFAYEVDYLTIDKNGTVSFDDRADSEEIETLVERLENDYGFTPEPVEAADEPELATGEVDETSVEAFEEEQSAEQPEEASESKWMEENTTAENELAADQAADEPISLTIEMPREGFTESALENLHRLVDNKAAMIRKALDVDTLPIEVTDDKVSFPWFANGSNPNDVQAYTHFVTALCGMAKTQKRVLAKELITDNEKYAFRCFLLRLGFIGKEFKTERKILLRNLTGSSAFRTPKGADNE